MVLSLHRAKTQWRPRVLSGPGSDSSSARDEDPEVKIKGLTIWDLYARYLSTPQPILALAQTILSRFSFAALNDTLCASIQEWNVYEGSDGHFRKEGRQAAGRKAGRFRTEGKKEGRKKERRTAG